MKRLHEISSEDEKIENSNKKLKVGSQEGISKEVVVETSSDGSKDNVFASPYKESEEESKSTTLDSSEFSDSNLEVTESGGAIKKESILNPQLEEKIIKCLDKIDEVANKDLEAPAEHLRNVLKVIKGVFDSPSSYEAELEELYQQDPDMLKAADEIADIVLIVNGMLPDMKRLYKKTASEDSHFIDYIIEVQEELTNILTARYSNFITCNEDFELTLIGE